MKKGDKILYYCKKKGIPNPIDRTSAAGSSEQPACKPTANDPADNDKKVLDKQILSELQYFPLAFQNEHREKLHGKRKRSSAIMKIPGNLPALSAEPASMRARI